MDYLNKFLFWGSADAFRNQFRDTRATERAQRDAISHARRDVAEEDRPAGEEEIGFGITSNVTKSLPRRR